MEIVSVDLGYGYVKAVSSTGKRVIFPSVVGEAKQLDLSNTFGKRPEDILFEPSMQQRFDDRLTLINESQFANAIGYLRLGKGMLSAKLSKEKMG